jgi:hypothetical protein
LSRKLGQIKSSKFAWNALGAILGAFAPTVPSWQDGLGSNGNDFGGLIAAILAPADKFGDFLMVICFISLASSGAILLYSFGEHAVISVIDKRLMRLLGLSFMCVSSKFAKVPRYLYSFVGTAM